MHASPSPSHWYVFRRDSHARGPLSTEEIQTDLHRGRLTSDALVCAVGETRWRKVSEIGAFSVSGMVARPSGGDLDAEDPTFDSRATEQFPSALRFGNPLRRDQVDFQDDSVPTWQKGMPASPGAYAQIGGLPPPLPPLQSRGLVPTSSRPPAAPRPSSRRGAYTYVLAAGLGLAIGAMILGAVVFYVSGGFKKAWNGKSDAASSAAPKPSVAPPQPSTDSSGGKGPVAASTGEKPKAPKDPCADVDVPAPICAWVQKTADGESAPRPAYSEVQVFLSSEGMEPGQGRVLSDASPDGRYKATSNSVFGYCLAPTSKVTNGEVYRLWVRRHKGTVQIEPPDLAPSECVLLEEVPVAGLLVKLMGAETEGPPTDETRALAQRTLKEIQRYKRLAD